MESITKEQIDYMEMWFARDKDGMLYVYCEKPLRDEENGAWEELELDINYQPLCLFDKYEDITWENSPIKVSDYFTVYSQKQWKPSEEQIRVVARLRHCLLEDVRGDDIMILDELLEELKGLKE